MNASPFLMQAIQATSAGQSLPAEASLHSLLAQEATHFLGLNMLTAISLTQGKAGEAEPLLARAVVLDAEAEAGLQLCARA